MDTTSSIFRKHNFIILDRILNNNEYKIEAKGFINPSDDVFDKPYIKKEISKPKINGNTNHPIRRNDSKDCKRSCSYQ